MRDTDVTLAVRAELVADRLTRAGLPALVGPARDGWVPVRPAPGLDPARVAAATGGLVLAARMSPRDDRLDVLGWRDGRPLPVDPAGLTAALGRPGAATGLGALLAGTAPAERVEEVAALLGVPAGVLVDGLPEREVALVRGDPGPAGTAAAVAGGGWLAEVGGWVLLAPARPTEPGLPLAAGASETGRRRDPALWLWRDGTDCGYLLWRRGRVRDGHTWQQAWTATPAVGPDLGPPVGDAAVLAAAVDRPDAEVPLRALFRRREPADTVLPELARLLGLPPAVPAVLAGTEVRDLPGARSVAPRSAWSAALDELPPESRRTSRVRLVVAAVLALVCALMAGLGVATLVTGGGAVDQDGAGWADAGWTLLFAGLAAVSVRTVLTLRARLR